MFTNLLVIKEMLNYIYKKYEAYIKPIGKFMFSMIIFTLINNKLGYAAVLNKSIVVVVLSLFFTVLPINWSILLVGITIITHLAFVSIEATILIGSLLVVMYMMYIRMVPKMGYIILAVPFLFAFKIPYIMPLMAGLFLTPMAILPISFGVAVYYFAENIEDLLKISSTEIADLPDNLMQMYKLITNTILGDRQMIFTIIIFAVIVVITYIVSRLDMDYSWYTAVGVASLSNIILFLAGDFALNLSVKFIWVFLGTLLSATIVCIMQFFKCTVDYSRAEKVQFEDDEYYYYVKAIPKIRVSSPQKKIKKISNN